MTGAQATTDRRGFRAPGTTFMVVGGLLGALGAYAFQLVGGRVLGAAEFAPVSLLWTVFFILATVLLVPVEQYVTREVAGGRRALPTDFKPTAAVAVVGSLLGGGFVALTLNDLFGGDWQFVAQIVLLVVGYSLLFVGKGVLAGSRRFAEVGWVLIIETVARLAAGVVAVLLFNSAAALGWAMVAGGFSVLVLRWWRHDRGDPAVEATPAGRFLTGYSGGTASSQILLGGAPLAVAALGASDALISTVFFTFAVFRAPLTLIFALQGRILPFLVGLSGGSDRSSLVRIARMTFLGGVLLAVLGAAVGWWIGPEVMELLFGPDAEPTRIVAMFAAGGVMAAAAAQVTSQVMVAEGRTSRLAWAWTAGLLVALTVLLVVGGEADTRVSLSFAAGEMAALSFMALVATRP